MNKTAIFRGGQPIGGVIIADTTASAHSAWNGLKVWRRTADGSPAELLGEMRTTARHGSLRYCRKHWRGQYAADLRAILTRANVDAATVAMVCGR